MLSRRFLINCLLDPIIFGFLLASCQSSPEPTDPSADAGQGTLAIRANGEDFIRQGFTSKDGWQLDFKQAIVNLGAVTAYQANPSFDPEGSQPLQAKQQVSLGGPQSVDLAAGDTTAEAIWVGTIPAPPGHYNALSWQFVKGPAGHSLVLQGLARKGAQQVPFTLKLDRDVAFVCGDYVGEERKGLLTTAGQADLEATFHFDHLFGDGSLSPEDELNHGALGFEPLAKLVTQGQLELTASELARQLPPEEAQKLETLWLSLGHVGEGHCQAKYL